MNFSLTAVPDRLVLIMSRSEPVEPAGGNANENYDMERQWHAGGSAQRLCRNH